MKFSKYDKNYLKINKLKAIINSGNQPVIIKILEGLTSIEARKKEKELIGKIGTIIEIPNIKRGSLTNLTGGGDGGATWFGKKMTQDHKDKISKALSGKMLSEERKRNISNAQLKREIKISKTHKNKLLEGLLNMSDESRKRISKATSNTTWINKNGKHKRIKMHDWENYFTCGWNKGFLCGGSH